MAALRKPHKHPRISPAELAYIDSDPPDPPGIKIPWWTLMGYRQTWMFIIGTGISGTIWWFWLYWGPDFLHKQYGLDIKHLGLPMVVIYLITGIGSITGGWLSGYFLKRGWSLNASRKMAMLVCALCVVPVFMASIVTNSWVGVLLVGLAMAAHQGFAANLITTVSDTAPRQVVGSIMGLGGTAACVGTFFIAILIPYILEKTGEYRILPPLLTSVIILLLSCFWLTAVMFSGCSRKERDVKVLKLAHALDTEHPVHKAMVFMADKVKEKSQGRMRIDIYPSEQLGSERECIEQLQVGALAITKASSSAIEAFRAENEGARTALPVS